MSKIQKALASAKVMTAFTMEMIDEMVVLLVGQKKARLFGDNIVGAGYEEQEEVGLEANCFLKGVTHGQGAGEISFYSDKGISLAQVDEELRIEREDEELAVARDKYRRWANFLDFSPKATEASEIKLEDFTDKMVVKSNFLKERKLSQDTKLRGEAKKYTDKTPSLGFALKSYLEMYVDKMTLGHLAVVLDQIETLRPLPKDKVEEGTEQLSWYYYTVCGLSVSHRLATHAPLGGWEGTRNMFWDNYVRFHQEDDLKACTVDDRFHGEISINMEAAIDTKRAAEKIAARHNVSCREAFMMLQVQQEKKALSQLNFLVEIA